MGYFWGHNFGRIRAGLNVFFALVCLLFAGFAGAAYANDSDTVILDAEKIIYDDESGTASAEGGALLSYGDIRITAERIDYDDESGKVIASALDSDVVLSNNQYTLRGDRLEYDIRTEEGVFRGARTSVAVESATVYVKGENLEAIPYDTAVEKGLVSGKSKIDGQHVIKWDDVSLTTCKLEHPHYRLEAKRFIFTPGRRVVVKRPRIYLGEVYIFTYPFDYIINVQREKNLRSMILPKILYSKSRGFGVGFFGPITWEGGGLGLGASYAQKVGFEGTAFLEHRMGNNFSVGGGVEYTWDREWDEKITRPSAFLRNEGRRWYAELNWKKNQYIENQKNAEYQYRGMLDTSPELIVGTRWQRVGNNSWYRFLASWGEYRETLLLSDKSEATGRWHGRFKMSAENYGEGAGNVLPFWRANASTMFYDTQSMRQDVYSVTAGFKYNIGSMKAGTAYRRRWVKGESPLLWDFELEEEKIFQMVDFPLGKYFSVGVLGGYDLKASFIEELTYSLKYQNDCMSWEVVYKNDRNESGDDRVFLRVGLTGTGVGLETDEFDSPFAPPKDLNKK